MRTTLRVATAGAALVIGLACDGTTLAESDEAAAHDGFQDDDVPAHEDSFQDDDLPQGDCEGDECTGGASAARVGSACDLADHCESGVCAARFADGDAGPLACQAGCIDTMDSAMWCSDDAACCGSATCSPRGLCIVDDLAESEAELDKAPPDGD
ncbi:MAG: hypothetical protein AAF721_09445 [Myxococcota bacterium]